MKSLVILLPAYLVLILASGCGSDRPCRFDPECGIGEVGAFCADDRECVTGYCCDHRRCNEGMCTYRCDDDYDCPSDMRCSHSQCFFACDEDEDCALGFSCRHGNTVCEHD